MTHIELEDVHLGTAKAYSNALVVYSSGTKLLEFKRKKNWKRNEKDKEFACECTKSKKVTFLNASLSTTYVSSTFLLIESYFILIEDSGFTDNLSQDRKAYVEFHQISFKSQCIYVENNDRLEVKGLDTC